MGSFDRPKKRIHLWKKALIHFALCFLMGFFTGFAPTSSASLFSRSVGAHRPTKNSVKALEKIANLGFVNRSLMADIPKKTPATATVAQNNSTVPLPDSSDRQLIIVTTTRSGDALQDAFLRRLGCTLKLAPPPLLWVVVQARADAPATARVLRETGVTYRHLTFTENFTDQAAEADHQRNVALSHIEQHRIAGIVHFAGVSNVYELKFFEEIRKIMVLGSWPLAMLSANRKRVVVDGPICTNSSKVVGWLFKDWSSDKISIRNLTTDARINISGFAFHSSILWDPERWGRATLDTSQDSMKFVQEVLLEDETKLKGIPADCSKIMMWHLYIPRVTPLPSNKSKRK